VKAHNFEFKPDLIFMVQQFEFGGTPLEDSQLTPLGIRNYVRHIKA